MKKNNELHLTCSCHSHALHMQKDEECDYWYISFWQRGHQTGNPWKYRLICIWNILRTGTPYGDEVILEKKDMLELKEYLEEQLK